MFEDVKEIRNLTPHEVNIWIEGIVPSIRTIKPSRIVARLNVISHHFGEVDGIPVVRSIDREILHLPDPEPGVVYIASSAVAKEAKRIDVLSPDTTDEGAIRGGPSGRKIIAVKRLQCFAERS